MITRINNKKHSKALVIMMLTGLVLGVVVLPITQSKAAKVFSTESVFEEQPDSVKTVSKKDSADLNKIYTVAEKPAEFPGGLDGWRSYLEQNLKYPKKAEKRGTQGVVRLQMIVAKDGTVGDVYVLSELGDGLGDEALRVIKKGPKWIPAWQKGRNVTYRFVQTVTFQLQ